MFIKKKKVQSLVIQQHLCYAFRTPPKFLRSPPHDIPPRTEIKRASSVLTDDSSHAPGVLLNPRGAIFHSQLEHPRQRGQVTSFKVLSLFQDLREH